MYKLTLTQDERRAFDWIGDRYCAGKVSDLLASTLTGDEEWSGSGDITFHVPEHVAWEIDQLAAEEDYLWPCFSDRLKTKLQTFLGQIV